MSNKLVAAIEPLLAVPFTAWMETSKGACDREVLPEVAPQIAVALKGLIAGLIGAGKSELICRYFGIPAQGISKKKKKHSPRPSARHIRRYVCMNRVTKRGIGILIRHVETQCVVRWQKGRCAVLAWE